MTDNEFDLLCALINKEFGLSVKASKQTNIRRKISHRLKTLGFRSYKDYHEFLDTDRGKKELYNLSSYVTNNETYFFREMIQLETFSKMLGDIKEAKRKKGENSVVILSVGCASGEEPYTLNMMVFESALFVWGWNIRIAGIDIDSGVLKRARAGAYSKNSFRDMDENGDLIKRYFRAEDKRYVLKRSLAANVDFVRGNVLDREFLSNFRNVDVIFCRNLFIYMDNNSVKRAAENLYDCLSDSGVLFIGSAESLVHRTDIFTPQLTDGVVVYRKSINRK